MDQKKGTAATRAKNKYNAENYDRLYPYVKRGKKERYQRAAEAAGYSLNEFVEMAMDRLGTKSWGKSNGTTRAGVGAARGRPAGIINFLCSDYYHGFCANPC